MSSRIKTYHLKTIWNATNSNKSIEMYIHTPESGSPGPYEVSEGEEYYTTRQQAEAAVKRLIPWQLNHPQYTIPVIEEKEYIVL